MDTDSIRDKIHNLRYAKSVLNPALQPNKDIRLIFKFHFVFILLGLVGEASYEKKTENRPHGLVELFNEKLAGLPQYKALLELLISG